MEFELSDDLEALRGTVQSVCGRFREEYWRSLEPDTYPEEFVETLTSEGLLSVLVPTTYGGGGLGVTAASVVLEEVNALGGKAATCHAQMYILAILARYASDEQKQRYLGRIARGELRLQAFAVSEPSVGSDTTHIQTTASRVAEGWCVNGTKMWVSRIVQSDLMLLLARTTPQERLNDKTRGLSLFLVDLRDVRDRLVVRPVETMLNHHTTEVEFRDVVIPEDALLGDEGRGFRQILDGMNAERVLVAGECIGDGRWFVQRATEWANSRVVFGRRIGINQGVQFPIAAAYANVQAADLLRYKAGWLFDNGRKCGAEANMAKLLASEAAWQAANVCLDTYGGFGFAKAWDVERKFRETRLYTLAPVSRNLILGYLAEHVLGLPRSY